MSPIDYAVPVGGILLILVIIYLTGGYKTARVGDLDAARLFADQLPGFTADDILVAADGLAALARDVRTGALAVAYAMGDRINVRALPPGDVTGIRMDDEGRLTIRLDDFTHGSVTLVVDKDAGNLNHWTAALEDLTDKGAA